MRLQRRMTIRAGARRPSPLTLPSPTRGEGKTATGEAGRSSTRGFTLVELITAASLMTVMMLGVVEIFGIVTETASEAEAQNFANQQLRTLLDTLNRDIHGMTHQGYFRILPKAVYWNNSQWQERPAAADGTIPIDSYSFYTFGFVSIGPWKNSISARAYPNVDADALAAEVVYTNLVSTPSAVLAIDGNAADIRRGVLARGVWLMNDKAGSNTPQQSDYSKSFGTNNDVPYLAGMAAKPGNISDGTGVAIWPPLRSNSYTSTNATTLSRAMATCTTEFLVEHWDATNNTWSKTNVDFNSSQSNTWPRAIRVTAAVADPDSRGPLPGSQNRFQGYAMQEVYWIGDP